jgi:hypothetical protein
VRLRAPADAATAERIRIGSMAYQGKSPAVGNSLEVVYANCSAAQLYEATARAGTQLGFKILSQDPTSGTLVFSTTVPTTSWLGPEISARITTHGDAARIVVTGTRVAAYRLALADWLQVKRVSLLLLERLSSVLPEEVELAPSPAPAPSRLDELESLADLRNRGVLTEEEFDAEKKKLLS